MNIAIVGKKTVGGGSIRVKSIANFLINNGHYVDVILFPRESLFSKMWFNYQRLNSKISGKIPKLMKKISNNVINTISNRKYDTIIGIETRESYFLTNKLDMNKIFFCESLEAEQMFFSGKYEPEVFRKLKEMELEIIEKSDYVAFPWETTEDYARKKIGNMDKFLTIRYGCVPQKQKVNYSNNTKIISLGNLGGYWTNKELLSNLTKHSPFPIEAYGKNRPPKKYNINFMGFAKALDVLYDYQFGLNTVSKDEYRKNHFSSRPLGYISYGLPTLSPDWHIFTNNLGGSIPYNEENFFELINKYRDQEEWEKKSREAIEQAKKLKWEITLNPLLELLS